MEYLQQGDVLLKPMPLPSVKGLAALEDGVLAHGEATGHAHRLHGDGFFLYEDKKTKRKHLRVVKDNVMLRHEEHKAFAVPPGDYVVEGVREYDHFEEESRLVVD